MNPLAPSRQHLYNVLSGSTTLTDTYGFTIEPEWPQEETSYPMIFLDAVPNLVTPIGSDRIDDNGLADIHIVFDRRTPLATQDAVLDEVIDLAHRTRGANAKGMVSSCSIENIIPTPYKVEDDFYPRRIVRCRVFASGQ